LDALKRKLSKAKWRLQFEIESAANRLRRKVGVFNENVAEDTVVLASEFEVEPTTPYKQMTLGETLFWSNFIVLSCALLGYQLVNNGKKEQKFLEEPKNEKILDKSEVL